MAVTSGAPWSNSAADGLVAEEDARRDAVPPDRRTTDRDRYVMTTQADDMALATVAASLGKGAARPTAIRCNLLIIETNTVATVAPTVWGIRYVNANVLQQEATAKAR